MKQFICKQGASNYYLVNDGMGGFLNPPTHPEHSLAYLHVREFYPDHKPDMERLAGNCKGGQWSTEG